MLFKLMQKLNFDFKIKIYFALTLNHIAMSILILELING